MAGTGGFSTTGFPVATAAQAGPNMLVSIDTENPNGSSPQTIALPLGLINQAQKVTNSLTALAGGGKTGATQLSLGINRISVCATAADSCLMPPAIAGNVVFVRNDGAASTTIYGSGTDTIDAVASATGNAQANAKGKLYYAITGVGDGVAGTWVTLLGA